MKKIIVCLMLVAFLVTSGFVKVNASPIPLPLTPGYGPANPTNLIDTEKRMEDDEAFITQYHLEPGVPFDYDFSTPGIQPLPGVDNSFFAVFNDLKKNLQNVKLLCPRDGNGGIPNFRGTEIYTRFTLYLLRN